MDIARRLTAIFAIVGAVMPAVCFSEIVYLKEMPKEGDVPFGKIVYVDDRKCPRVKSRKSRAVTAKRPLRVKCAA